MTRGLTRLPKIVIFKTQGAKSVSDYIDADQLDVFVACRTRGPRVYEGAAPLLPLPWR